MTFGDLLVLKALKCIVLVNNFLQNRSSFVLIKKISFYEAQKLWPILYCNTFDPDQLLHVETPTTKAKETPMTQ